MSKHTPTPWYWASSPCAGANLIVDGKENTSAIGRASKYEDVAHIVKCVNNYPKLEALNAELVSSLEKLLSDTIKSCGRDNLYYSEDLKPIENLIARAKGGV